MNKLYLYLAVLICFSCEKSDAYKIIDHEALKKLKVQDTLVENKKVLVTKVLDSDYPKLLVWDKLSNRSNHYLFDMDCELENDSTIIYYAPPFLVDENGEFQKNGLWVYTKFYRDSTSFGVDSIPKNKIKKLPQKEGIYFYQNDSLVRLSKDQSEEKFNSIRRNGFYFIPNTGRLFERININQLD